MTRGEPKSKSRSTKKLRNLWDAETHVMAQGKKAKR